MKKTLSIAAVLFAVACSSPESQADNSSDSANKNENTITNSPPGFTTDTTGVNPADSTSDTMHHHQ